MAGNDTRNIQRVTALVFSTAIIFYFFFQFNKLSPFVEASPFANDPYDFVGSIAIQAAFLIGLLSYARTIRQRVEPSQDKSRLVLHGNILALAAISITLLSDLLAVFLVLLPASRLVSLVRLELALMLLLTAICWFSLWSVFRRISTSPPPGNLTPADAIDDVWSLVCLLVVMWRIKFPKSVVEWVQHFNSDRIFAHLPWIDPRLHPWRFTTAAGLLVGVLLVLFQFREGPPPSLAIGLLLVAIFISVELIATLAGFAVFGGYLGLRSGSRSE